MSATRGAPCARAASARAGVASAPASKPRASRTKSELVMMPTRWCRSSITGRQPT